METTCRAGRIMWSMYVEQSSMGASGFTRALGLPWTCPADAAGQPRGMVAVARQRAKAILGVRLGWTLCPMHVVAWAWVWLCCRACCSKGIHSSLSVPLVRPYLQRGSRHGPRVSRGISRVPVYPGVPCAAACRSSGSPSSKGSCSTPRRRPPS